MMSKAIQFFIAEGFVKNTTFSRDSWLDFLQGLYAPTKVFISHCVVLLFLSGNLIAKEPDHLFSLPELANEYGFSPPQEQENYLALHGAAHHLRFKKNSRLLEHNEMLVWLNRGTIVRENNWSLPGIEVRKVIDPLLRPLHNLKNASTGVIVLDAGHGGKDDGATGPGAAQKEKNIALYLTLSTAEKLKSAGHNVALTRWKDNYIELEDRANLALKLNAAVFISIHLNQSNTPKVSGIETYALSLPGHRSSHDSPDEPPDTQSWPGNAFDAENAVLAHSIHHALTHAGSRTDRGVKRARFVVLKHAPCPAALIECGFLSNPTDHQLFQKNLF